MKGFGVDIVTIHAILLIPFHTKFAGLRKKNFIPQLNIHKYLSVWRLCRELYVMTFMSLEDVL